MSLGHYVLAVYPRALVVADMILFRKLASLLHLLLQQNLSHLR